MITILIISLFSTPRQQQQQQQAGSACRREVLAKQHALVLTKQLELVLSSRNNLNDLNNLNDDDNKDYYMTCETK